MNWSGVFRAPGMTGIVGAITVGAHAVSAITAIIAPPNPARTRIIADLPHMIVDFAPPEAVASGKMALGPQSTCTVISSG
jgi:hypothetical protein